MSKGEKVDWLVENSRIYVKKMLSNIFLQLLLENGLTDLMEVN